VLRRLAAGPDGDGVEIVDLAHDLPAGDVRAGAAMLERSVDHLADGVVLAVVDPGVGSDRRRVALDCGRLALVGPDNGVLVPAAERAGLRRVVELAEPRFWLTPDTSTFDGRDVFAPVAARLCSGLDLAELGPGVAPASLVRPEPPVRRLVGGILEAEVTWVDRFGNVALAAGADELAALGPGPYTVRVPAGFHTARLVAAFADLGPDELGALIDSSGQLALVRRLRSAAEVLGSPPGTLVVIGPA